MQNETNNKIKVSIIVPVYNVEKYLGRCLDSLVNQTLKDIEIICVNDGSPDNSLDILNSYAEKDSRIVIINQENQGLSAARNAGLKIATGEYIGFVDSDDYIEPNYYEKLYTCAKNNNANIAVTSVIRERKKGSSYRIQFNEEKVYTDKSDIFNACDCPNICYVWNKIYKTDKLKSSGINFQTGMYFEDVLFTTKILATLGSLVTVPETYYHYMINDGSSIVKSTQTPKKNQDRYNNQKEAILFCIENNIKIKNREYCINTVDNKWIKFLNIKLLKVKDNIKTSEHVYLLFNLIPVFKKPFNS